MIIAREKPLRFNHKITVPLLVVFLGVVAFTANTLPRYNWDMLPYIGTVHSWEDDNPESIHRNTYDVVEKAIPAEDYDLLTKVHWWGGYRKDVAENAQYFVQQLPFFSVKPAYPALILVVHTLGVGLVEASIFISNFAYFLIGLLLYTWLARYTTPLLSLIITCLLSALPYMFLIARTTNPDALSTLVVLTGLYMLFELKRIHWGLLILVVSISVRPDNIILLALVSIYIALFKQLRWHWATAYVLAGFGLYKLQVIVSGNYGWTTLFYNAMVEFQSNLEGFESPLKLADYAAVYMRKFNQAYLNSEWPYFFVLAILGIFTRLRVIGWRDRYLHLLFIIVLYMLLHKAVFPGIEARMYALPYTMILLTYAIAAGGLLSGRSNGEISQQLVQEKRSL